MRMDAVARERRKVMAAAKGRRPIEEDWRDALERARELLARGERGNADRELEWVLEGLEKRLAT